MGRKPPPPGYITFTQAKKILGSAVYRYIDRGAIKHYVLPKRKQGFYKLSEVEEVKRIEQAFFEQGILSEGNEQIEQVQEEPTTTLHNVTFEAATLEDMDGVDFVASQLFPDNPSAGGDRRPLLAREPLGNYVVKDNGAVVAYLHIQPLRNDILEKFMSGQIRGPQLRADDLEPFTPGKPTSVLIKGIGAIGEGRWPSYYIRRLLIGAAKDLGHHGIVVSKMYATSDTPTGIGMSLHANMKTVAKLGHGRFGFELDVEHSDLPLARIYHQALEEWRVRYASDRATIDIEPSAVQDNVNIPTTPVRRIVAKSGKPEDTLPHEYIGFTDMFRDHNVSETTARRGIGEAFNLIPSKWYARGRIVRFALDRQGKRGFLRYAKEHGGYTPCKDVYCPCHKEDLV